MLKEMLRNLRVYWMVIILSHDHLLEPHKMEVDASNDVPGHVPVDDFPFPAVGYGIRSLEGKKLGEF